MTDHRIVFVDVETTGLDPDRHHIWEIAVILRDPDTEDAEHHWMVRADLETADPASLRIGRYYERTRGWGRMEEPEYVAGTLAPMLDGAYLAGAVPSFDAAFLARFLRRHGQCPTWHHRLICVETMAATVLDLPVPLGLTDSADALGVPLDTSVTHTALGDARLARGVYDATRARVHSLRFPEEVPF